MTESELEQKSVRAIHPSFRVIAIGGTPSVASPWLTCEVICPWLQGYTDRVVFKVATMFSFHVMPAINLDDQISLLLQMVPTAPPATVQSLCNLAHALDEQDSASLSFRQLVRLTLRAAFQPEDDQVLRTALSDCTMMPFLPIQSQEALGMVITSAGFKEVK